MRSNFISEEFNSFTSLIELIFYHELADRVYDEVSTFVICGCMYFRWALNTLHVVLAIFAGYWNVFVSGNLPLKGSDVTLRAHD